jgi:hypothetical protein
MRSRRDLADFAGEDLGGFLLMASEFALGFSSLDPK